ncbi:RDD family protein [Salipaludibacillus sp. HK11]|uniref:RDD family protein n=1 Tax=Salipaludibacillus sp. HK11 TaxID=3394320 RepID=UPI0039FBE0D1
MMSEEQKLNMASEQEYIEVIENSRQGTEVTILYAGFWMRVWAYLVDLFVVSSLNGILLVPLFLAIDVNLSIGIFTVGGVISTIVAFTYFTLMTKYFRQTLGKQLLGIKVYSYKNEDLTWMDVVFREIIGRYLHQSIVITNILYLFVAFSPEKRGIHDRIGNTFVGLEPRKGRIITVEASE